MRDLLIGALAGIVGTYSMTVAKEELYPLLPHRQRYPLPPREITQDVAERALGRSLPPGPMTTATLASHFGFGALCGAGFAALGLHRRRAVRRGAAYGLGVWAASYLGWLPLARILTPATRHPAERNALMIAVHVVWGGVTGLAASRLARSPMLYGGDDPLPDRARSRRTAP